MRIFISQIFISDLYIFTFIFRSSYVETTSCLHTFGSSSSSHTVLILSSSRFHHAIIIPTLQLDIFTSSKLHLPLLSGQPSSSCCCCFLLFCLSGTCYRILAGGILLQVSCAEGFLVCLYGSSMRINKFYCLYRFSFRKLLSTTFS